MESLKKSLGTDTHLIRLLDSTTCMHLQECQKEVFNLLNSANAYCAKLTTKTNYKKYLGSSLVFLYESTQNILEAEKIRPM